MDTVLIVDDKINVCRSISQNLVALGYDTHYATNGYDGLKILANQDVDVVLLDIALGEQNGIQVLRRFRNLRSDVPVIMITGYGTIESAVQAIKLGAFEYVQKPINFNKLLTVIDHAITMARLGAENQNLKERLGAVTPQVVSGSESMACLKQKAMQLAATDLPILICGESGTGKEGLAEFIHACSPRNGRALIKINCAAFPEHLLDNELFGHEPGAYTGAESRFHGVFERAHKGTLLMDEVADMSLQTQAKILRALQNREIRRIGGTEMIEVDVRFIAATNQTISELIEEGRFREDLYYRLNTATLTLPPLRSRKEDIPLLTDFFLKEFSRNNEKSVASASDEVVAMFLAYDWPGNIRELKNIVQFAAAVSLDEVITPRDLPPNFLQAVPELYDDSASSLETRERELILQTLHRTSYNKAKTAALLRISRKTLYNKLKRYELNV